jgi:hypothetical protein
MAGQRYYPIFRQSDLERHLPESHPQSESTMMGGGSLQLLYAGTPERRIASCWSTATERTTWLIVEAYHLPPLAVGLSSAFRGTAMALSDFPPACSDAIAIGSHREGGVPDRLARIGITPE